MRCQSAGDGATCSAGPDSHGCCWWRGRRLRASARPAGFLCHVLLTETRRLAAAKNLPASRIGAAAWWCAECTCSCGCYHYYWQTARICTHPQLLHLQSRLSSCCLLWHTADQGVQGTLPPIRLDAVGAASTRALLWSAARTAGIALPPSGYRRQCAT